MVNSTDDLSLVCQHAGDNPPSIGKIKKWLDTSGGPGRPFAATHLQPLGPEQIDKFYDRNGKLIRTGPMTEPSTEERQLITDHMKELVRAIKDKGKPDWRSEPMMTEVEDRRDPKELMASLNNLEAHRRPNEAA